MTSVKTGWLVEQHTNAKGILRNIFRFCNGKFSVGVELIMSSDLVFVASELHACDLNNKNSERKLVEKMINELSLCKCPQRFSPFFLLRS